MNKTEDYQFKNLKNLFENNPQLITNYPQKYTLINNSASPSGKRDFILNSDSIFKSNSLPIIYVQNSSFSNNFYIQKNVAKLKKDSNLISLKRTVLIGEKLEGKDLIQSIVNSLNAIFKNKNNYTDFPDNKSAFAFLYLSCDTLLEFQDESFSKIIDYLGFKLNQYIKDNNINNNYARIIVTFNPLQVHEDNNLNIAKSIVNINELTRNVVLNLSATIDCEKSLVEELGSKIKMHEYFLL
ncbi:MAG: hypothetical protein HRT99_02285 [Mycoplasmatales bacterium]|nr:hypothetical protein [Mycoplasmatales bacterium]